jgi:hypothetical protein
LEHGFVNHPPLFHPLIFGVPRVEQAIPVRRHISRPQWTK